jgi:undecaprenyl-diphosphatase
MSNRIVNSLIRDLSSFGGLPFYLFLSFFVMLLGELKLFLWLIIGMIISYLIVIIIRIIFYKERPRKEKYNTFIEKIDASSFPSLHSFRITLIFWLFYFNYKSLYITIMVFFIGLAVFFSRYYLKKHFRIDIFWGFILGLVTSFAIVHLF